jgi:hypothetical protein
LIVLVAAIVVGAYFLIIKFDDAHENATIEYVLLVDKAYAQDLEKGSNVYMEKYGSVVYLGNIVDINDKIEVDNGTETEYVSVTVRADVQYRDDEGYMIDDEKIAVGRTLSVRVKSVAFMCDIVELTVISRK